MIWLKAIFDDFGQSDLPPAIALTWLNSAQNGHIIKQTTPGMVWPE
jgi:hypothetical protein